MKRLLAGGMCSLFLLGAMVAQAQTPTGPDNDGVTPPMPRSAHDPMTAPPASERDMEMQERDQDRLERNHAVKHQDNRDNQEQNQ